MPNASPAAPVRNPVEGNDDSGAVPVSDCPCGSKKSYVWS